MSTHGRTADTEVLAFIAESVTALAGFELAAISIVDGDELQTVAVSGSDDAASELMELRAPVASVLAELAPADAWGRLRFLPHDRAAGHLHGFEWVPDIEPGAGPDAWHPEDLLCALLLDAAGQLRGLLSIDLPHDGRRPTPEQRELLNHHASQAERAVVAYVERDELAVDLEAERELSQYRARLIGAIAHELKAPAAVVLGHAELALDGPDDERLRRHLDAVVRGAQRLARVAGDLLDMSRVDNPDHPLTTEPVDLRVLVTDTAALFTEEARRREVDVRVGPRVHAVVDGDRHELESLVYNLLSNAIKYSDPGGRVDLDVAVDDVDVVLTVADTGLGIADDEVGEVFGEFFRSAAPDARSRPGTGLGLAIVERVVRRHRGTIDVSSTLGEGTTLTVHLPRAR